MGFTWSICKINMLLHGIAHADIRQEDTIKNPAHMIETNELRRYDRVLANPPFSQNYSKKDLKLPGRFPVLMPEKGKKADLMFVQHMLSVLKSDGKLATIMPHGVLFRGGEEREARKYFIDKGYLEAVIGLPSNLFYGTGIPACILVMNKAGANDRKHVLFINAAREYREGKAQNFLRPEDIDKIVHVYREGRDLPAYARYVPKEEIAAEDYNCNIRRYVDNAPPPEPHDVRAHLYGGVPLVEVESLGHFWINYTRLKESCFNPRSNVEGWVSPESVTHQVREPTLGYAALTQPTDCAYADFTVTLKDKRAFLQGCAEFGPRNPEPEIYCYPPLRIAKQGSILISVRAPVGTINMADQAYCIGRGLGAIQGMPGVAVTSFLRYAIKQKTGFLHRRSQGSTFLAIGSELKAASNTETGYPDSRSHCRGT